MLIQRHTTSIRPLTTAHLAQTMTLLGLSFAELQQKIESELAANPALELVEERRCPTCHRPLGASRYCPACANAAISTPDQPLIFVSSQDSFHTPGSGFASDPDLPDDNLSPARVNLAEYVLRQIAPELEPEDRPLAVHILTSLDDDGLLRLPLIEIARYHHRTITETQQVVQIIQRADPPGVGSATPQEALLAQLEMIGESQLPPPFTAEAIHTGLEYLNPARAIDLARLLGINPKQARTIIQYISRNLNPYPARAYWGEGSRTITVSGAQPAYYHPDIIISLMNTGSEPALMVEIGLPIHGTLRVNPLFRQALQHAPLEKAALWQQDLESASLLVKCLQQRTTAIVRLMQQIAVIQRPFILHGDAHLVPLTRAQLARILKVHESTISRTVSAKTVQLPNRRIVPLAIFFDRSLHIRTVLKEIVQQETKPLDDAELMSQLKDRGYSLARRTVAKYRSMEGILPVYLRKPVEPA